VKRLTTLYKIPGTKNFRLASAKVFGYYGCNLQNPTDSVMECVIPNDGCVFIQPDQGGAEALVVAYECRRAHFRKLFENNIKPHSYMALQIFTDMFRGEHPASRYKAVEPGTLAGYPEAKDLLTRIKNSAREYDLGKRVIHAKNYDMGPRTFQVNVLELSEGSVVLSYKESKEFLSIHSETFPEIIEWQIETKERLYATRELRNLFGFPRQFNQLWSSELLRDAYAFLPQSTVGTITNIAYTELHNRIKRERLPWHMLNNKHDSFLLEVPDNKEHTDMGIAYCREHLGRELVSLRGEHYRMKVGISVGHNWGKKSKTNPDGMVEL
jgi:hypothetical protein